MASLFTFGVLFLLKLVFVNVSYLNPISKALEDFQLTDLYFSNLQQDNNEVNQDIVLVNIGFKDRAAIAEQLSTIQKYKPKVIGLDAIFYEPKDSLTDQLLAHAIGQSKNTVIINKLAYVEGNENPSLIKSTPIFSNHVQQGFSNFLAEENQTVRYVKPSIELDGKIFESFSSKLVRQYSPLAYKAFQKREGKVEVINYKKENFIKLDVDDLENPALSSLLKNKIVLMGFMGSHLGEINFEDLHLTPLNKSFGGHSVPDMYGIEIHANIISMMLSGEYIKEIPQFWNYFIAFLLTFLNMALYIFLSVRYENWASRIIKIVQIFSFGFLFFLTIFALHYIHLKMEPALLLIAVVLASEVLVLYSEIALWMHKKWGYKTYFSKN